MVMDTAGNRLGWLAFRSDWLALDTSKDMTMPPDKRISGLRDQGNS